jgi:cytidylate kinase
MLERLIVTIDGPAGSGKSTTASLLAERLGYAYLDTGAMYRAVTYAVLERGIDVEDEAAVTRAAEDAAVDLQMVDGTTVLLLNGADVTREIREPVVSRQVSPVSRYAGVRRAMVRLQRRVGARGGIIVEGRDTGSVVFPHAQVKVYLIASLEARTARRRLQLKELGIEEGIEEIRNNIEQRDSIDSSREHSPLVRPPGSLAVDTTDLTIEEQVALIESHVRETAERLTKLAAREGTHDRHIRMRLYYRISHAAVRWVFRLLFGLRIYGEAHLRTGENFLFASNHQSYADPLVVGSAIPREVWFLAKKELFRNRLFAWLIRTYHAIPIDRDEIDRKTMKIVLENLKRGDSILMFPEGTRSRDGSILPLKAGLGFIALVSRVTVVPVYVTGSNSLCACLLRRSKLEVRIGPPIRIEEEYRSDDKKQDYWIFSDMVREALRMLQDEA